jgi:hypothetical protein
VRVTEWAQFVPALDGKNITLCAWCDTTACEDAVKKRSGEESLKAKSEENAGFKLTGMSSPAPPFPFRISDKYPTCPDLY